MDINSHKFLICFIAQPHSLSVQEFILISSLQTLCLHHRGKGSLLKTLYLQWLIETDLLKI
jgi:hypothetical protein